MIVAIEHQQTRHRLPVHGDQPHSSGNLVVLAGSLNDERQYYQEARQARPPPGDQYRTQAAPWAKVVKERQPSNQAGRGYRREQKIELGLGH
ncbi:MAG: hypothetical protein ACK56I_05390 [bacterium]